MMFDVEAFDQSHLRSTSRVRCSQRLNIPDYYNSKDRSVKQKCKHNATFKVNGKPYCTRHAGELALKHLLNSKSE